MQGSAEFSNICVNITAAFSIGNGFEVAPVSTDVAVDSDRLLVKLRTDMDARVGAKIMSEIQTDETSIVLRDQLASLIAMSSVPLGDALTCQHEVQYTVQVPTDLASDSILFSLGG